MKNLEETFIYDNQNRFTEVWLGTTQTGVSAYDSYGRMTTKTADGNDVFSNAVFNLAKPHAMDAATTSSGVFPVDPQTVTYTSFDKVKKIKQGNDSVCFTYGYDHQRIFMDEHVGNRHRTYLTGPTGVYAVVVTENGRDKIHYILKDNLGSWTTVADEEGSVEQQLSYDAWGNLRNPSTWSGNFSGIPMFDRGYTLHEHYDDFDLINMNGRLYDPILGRMLSPDVVIQDEQNSQAYNRYSYCFNNPLRFTDPSGYVVRGSRNYFDWNSMTYLNLGNYRNNGNAFNTDMSEGKFSPVYDVNGVLLGTTKEGFSGQVLIYAGSEDIDFSSLSESDALLIEGVSTYDLLSEKLPGETKSNIWTNIVSQMEGARVYDVVFHMSDLRENKIIFNPNINAGWSSSYALKTGEGKIQGSDKYHYETTVENIQSTIVIHEYYSHIKKNNGDNYRSHRLAYKNVINYKPLWNKTTDAYKGFVVRRLLEYTKRETGRTKVDPPYRYSYNKYRDYY